MAGLTTGRPGALTAADSTSVVIATDQAAIPVTATPVGTQDVNITQVGGVAVSSVPVTQSNVGTVDSDNSSTSTLNAGLTFTGTWKDVSIYPSVVVAVKTDQAGTLYIEFSPDGTNADSSLSYSVAAATNEVHRITVTRKYFRTRFTNTSASNQTYFRLQAMLGAQQTLTSSLNNSIQDDADTILVRPLDFNLMVAEGLYQNRSTTVKDGINTSLTNSAALTQDLWTSGSVYTGFPTGSPEAAEIVVAGADTGTVYYTYMASSSSTSYTSASKAITGAGTYSLGHNIWRCNFAYFVGSSSTSANVGAITIRNNPTTANIFCVIDAGIGQSYCAAYTVPSGNSIYMDRSQGGIRGGVNASVIGYMWYRPTGESPRLRFPFFFDTGSFWFDDVDYLTRIPAGTDIMPRITSCSANGVQVQFTYRFIRVTQ